MAHFVKKPENEKNRLSEMKTRLKNNLKIGNKICNEVVAETKLALITRKKTQKKDAQRSRSPML